MSSKEAIEETSEEKKIDESKTDGEVKQDGDGQVEVSKNNRTVQTRTALFLIALIFLASASALIAIYLSFPKLEPSEAEHFKFPTNLEEAKRLGLVLNRYKDKYFWLVFIGVNLLYLFLQTFAIPGSLLISILSGYLFSFPLALLVVCFCSATGASFCFLLSYLMGRSIVYKYFPERAAVWAAKVQDHKDNMLGYIIFLRVTPFVPNWFINITSPIIDVDLRIFWLGTFLGVAPPSFFYIQAGTTLQELTSTSEAFNVGKLLILMLFALVSIIPAMFKNRYSSETKPKTQ